MVNKLKALAERVENYKALAISAAELVARQRGMREDIEKAGMDLGLTRAVMNEMLPTLKEAATLIVPALPEPVTLSGTQAPEIDPTTDAYVGDYAGGPLVMDNAGYDVSVESPMARTPEPLFPDLEQPGPANALDGTAI